MMECTRELVSRCAPDVICRTPRMIPMTIQAKPSETRIIMDHLRADGDSIHRVTERSQHSSFDRPPPTPKQEDTHAPINKLAAC